MKKIQVMISFCFFWANAHANCFPEYFSEDNQANWHRCVANCVVPYAASVAVLTGNLSFWPAVAITYTGQWVDVSINRKLKNEVRQMHNLMTGIQNSEGAYFDKFTQDVDPLVTKEQVRQAFFKANELNLVCVGFDSDYDMIVEGTRSQL